MENRNFDRNNAEKTFACGDEGDFYAFCRKCGLSAQMFEQSDGWQGVYTTTDSGVMVYYYGDEVMRFYGNN